MANSDVLITSRAYSAALRPVSSEHAMTADWTRVPYECLMSPASHPAPSSGSKTRPFRRDVCESARVVSDTVVVAAYAGNFNRWSGRVWGLLRLLSDEFSGAFSTLGPLDGVGGWVFTRVIEHTFEKRVVLMMQEVLL